MSLITANKKVISQLNCQRKKSFDFETDQRWEKYEYHFP